MSSFEFKRLEKRTPLAEGSLIKGYTYSIGDFHTQNEKHLGEPKLRKGVILKKYSNKYFLVQFENSAAKRPEKGFKTNIIRLEKVIDPVCKTEIVGTDAYCILLQRSQIKQYDLNFKILDLEKTLEEISTKHSREKKRAIRFIGMTNLFGFSREEIDDIFERLQFTPTELLLTQDWALTKMVVIKFQHDQEKCTLNEYKRYKNCLSYVEFPINNLDSLALNNELKDNFNDFTKEECDLFCEILEKEWESNEKNKTNKRKIK